MLSELDVPPAWEAVPHYQLLRPEEGGPDRHRELLHDGLAQFILARLGRNFVPHPPLWINFKYG
jgi:hypothetical protein